MSLKYETTNWENGKTVLKAEHLRKIEKGITDIMSENYAIYTDEDMRKSNEINRQNTFSNKVAEVNNKITEINNFKENMTNAVSNKIDEIETRFNTLTSKQQQDSEVIDARAGAVSLKARLDNFDSQLEHNTSQLKIISNRELLLSELGCTSEESDATKNVTIIKNLIDSGHSFTIDIDIPINDTIIIGTSFNGKTISGKNKKIIMISDNIPIFKFDTILTNSCKFENFDLYYKTLQNVNCENSIALCFESNENKSWGWYDLIFRNINIFNSYIGIGNVTNEPVWDCVFENILIGDTYKHAISLNRYGQLGIQFKNLRIRNYGIRDTEHENDGSTCILLMGEFSFSNLTVEDWNGQIFRSDDCRVSIDNLHIERSRFLVDDYLYVFSINGYLSVKNATMTFTKMNVPTKFVRIFEVPGSSGLSIDGFKMGYNDELFNGIIFLVNGYENSNIITYNITGVDVINTSYNSLIKNNTKSIINGVPIINVIKHKSKPVSFEYKQGDIIYKQDLVVGEGIGWVAIANSKNTNTLNFTVTTNYNTVVNTNISNVNEVLKVGDGVIIGDSSIVYTVKSLTNNSFVVYPQPNQNFQNATIRNATTSEVLKEFGIIA